MEVHGMKLTSAGLNILSQGLTGAQILFTRVGLGDGTFDYESESVLDVSEMRSWRKDLPIVEIKIVGDGQVTLVARQTNSDVAEGFFCREYAVFAINPADGKEKLYSYVNFGDECSYLPSNLGPVTKEIRVGITTVIQNAANVTAILDASFAYTSRTDFLEHVNERHPHPNIPNHYNDVTDTENFWVTDKQDGHLHKMSAANVKEVLTGETTELLSETRQKLNELERATKARSELGIDGNVLLVEDFEPVSELDEYSCKVLSSARGGRLIGIDDDEGVIIGGQYKISDGVSEETVRVKGVAYGTDYYHVTLELPLTYEYTNAKMYRTTYAGASKVDKKSLVWKADKFSGIEANVKRVAVLKTTQENSRAIEIAGDGYVTYDGFMTLKKDFAGSYTESEGGSTGAGGYEIVYEHVTDPEIGSLFDGTYHSNEEFSDD